MKKLIILVRSNLRKSKTQTISIFVFVLLAAMLLNIWLMLSLDYRQNFWRCHNRLNAEHVTMILDSSQILDNSQDEFYHFLEETVKKEKNTSEYLIGKTFWIAGSVNYNGGTVSPDFFILEKDAACRRAVGKYEITKESELKSGIYLPMLFEMGNNYSVGDIIDIHYGNNILSYTVCGFYNSAMTGSHNCGMCAFLATEDVWRELEQEAFIPASTMLSVRLHDKSQSEAYEAEIKNVISEEFPSVRTLSNSWDTVSKSRYISQMICSGIVSAMACFVLIISLVVIASSIINDIGENMKNLGALKAAGYTSRQLTDIFYIQFLGLALTGGTAGIALSYCLFPTINEMMVSQTGIPYHIHFLFLPVIITFLVLGGTSALVVYLSSRTVKKIDVITALRQGVETHNFKKNYFPLMYTRLPLQPALALKTAFSGIKKNITVCVTILVLSLIMVFSGVMIQNVIFDIQPMVDLIVGETADSCISIAAEREEEFLGLLDKDNRVEKAYLYNNIEVQHVGHIALGLVVIDDCTKINNQNLCIEGRFPKFENELLLGAKYAQEQNLRVGDEITLTADGNSADYIICGFTQISNYLGKDCLMLRSGYERMGVLPSLAYYINTEKNVDIDILNRDLAEKMGDSIKYTVNIEEAMTGMASVYVSVITMIVIVILILSVIIIAFVLFLLVRTLLSYKKRDYGILKALGVTTGQLIFQTALSFMPTVLLSLAAGLVISILIINPLIAMFASGIGMIKCTFEIPVGWIIIMGAGMAGFAFGFICLLAVRVRKIAPREMLSGE